MDDASQSAGFNINLRSYLFSLGAIFVLMVVTYILTLVIPAGEYTRVLNADGNLVIDQSVPFAYTSGGISFWKWLLSPVLVLGASGNAILIAVVIFLMVIGGIFNALDKSGVMRYMLDLIVHSFGNTRYRFMAVVIFFFMAMGSLIGSFEECIPMVPIVVAISVSLGWDRFTGMGMSLLAVACGFAAGICNPFTIGVAQGIAGLPMFSGIWLRVLSFVLIYALVLFFVRRHAKKIEQPLQVDITQDFKRDPKFGRALIAFASILGFGIVLVLCSPFIPALQDYSMIIVALTFLIAGVTAVLLSGAGPKRLGSNFLSGLISILPAVLMILMAASIRFTLEEASVLDTILHSAVGLSSLVPAWSVILIIYLIALVMNFFIPSGSAEAYMLIPLLLPLAQIFGIPAQLTIVAFAFGDGFSNAFYPTNPALLIACGLANVSYGQWIRWSWKFQLANLALTSGILLFGLAVGYC